jgi:hypothetical protein
MADCCKNGTEHWGLIKGGEFIRHLSDYQLLKKDSSSWRQKLLVNGNKQK